jgi:hypothetical protein
MRSALALALLDCDFENRFGFSLPIHVPDLVAQAVAHECRKHLQQSNSQHGMLKRMTLLEDDTKMVLATQSQGFIPISKYFEEMIIIPRVFSGTYVLDDKISAFYGRYSGSIGRKNFTTGVAFNGFILAYAHGGYGVAILFTVSAALALFILLPMVFGQSIRNLVAQSFLLTNGIESMISVHFVFYIVSRGLLNTVGGILVVYALMRITSGRKTPPETLERLSSSATN